MVCIDRVFIQFWVVPKISVRIERFGSFELSYTFSDTLLISTADTYGEILKQMANTSTNIVLTSGDFKNANTSINFDIPFIN